MSQKQHDFKFFNSKLLDWKGQVRSNVFKRFNLSLVRSSIIDVTEQCCAHSRIEGLKFSSINITRKCNRTRDVQSPPAEILIQDIYYQVRIVVLIGRSK